ncbi:MAG: hypothetical protein QM793_09185 [Muricomes sp.]
MSLITVLILFPLVTAIVVYLVRKEAIRNTIVRVGAVITAALTVLTAMTYFNQGLRVSLHGTEILDICMMVIEACLAVYIIVTGIKEKKYLLSLFSVAQIILIFWFELTQKHGLEAETGIILDKLSNVMILIVGIVGSLICLYAVGYMKSYHVHHAEFKRESLSFLQFSFFFCQPCSGWF